jgi:hypothetical protein
LFVYADFICREFPMTRAALAITLLFGSLPLAAQNGTTPKASSLYVIPTFLTATCPISMQANQDVWDHTIKIREGERERVLQPFGQKISLTLKDTHPARIQAATVRVDGLTGKNRMVQTGPNSANPDGIRTLRVRFAVLNDGRVSADLWLPGFTAVTSVELLEVSYADGSSWKISGSNVCRVQPDPLMLISNR